MKSSSEIIDYMYTNDLFSQWLGIERVQDSEGYCQLRMSVRDEMTNGFKIAHGGITYSLADSALAFAANSHGLQAVSIETSISHTRPVMVGDVLIAEAVEVTRNRKIAIYDVKISRGEEVVALFKGTVYMSGREWKGDF